MAQLSNRLDKVLKSMDTRLNETKYLINDLDITVTENRKNISKLLEEWRQVAKNLNDFADTGKIIIQNNKENIENLPKELTLLIRQLKSTSEDIGELINELKDQPSIIFSKPPEKSLLK